MQSELGDRDVCTHAASLRHAFGWCGPDSWQWQGCWGDSKTGWRQKHPFHRQQESCRDPGCPVARQGGQQSVCAYVSKLVCWFAFSKENWLGGGCLSAGIACSFFAVAILSKFLLQVWLRGNKCTTVRLSYVVIYIVICTVTYVVTYTVVYCQAYCHVLYHVVTYWFVLRILALIRKQQAQIPWLFCCIHGDVWCGGGSERACMHVLLSVSVMTYNNVPKQAAVTACNSICVVYAGLSWGCWIWLEGDGTRCEQHRLCVMGVWPRCVCLQWAEVQRYIHALHAQKLGCCW